MSRRAPNPAADQAAKNQQTIKGLLKLEGNKSCADCKRNKHPRWASWNLGIFVCIRCSGIHRGMGTHISRVKSVDLDTWTDEQLASVMAWGNSRANKYWEAKLAQGHVPSDSKIENFIRTKYESKRWVMEGPIPDPSTLTADGDDDVPLNVVQQKNSLDRSASQRLATASPAIPPAPPPTRQAQNFDLIGGDDYIPSPPARPSTTDNATAPGRAPPPKQQAPSQLLGGLDFFGAPERPASASSSSQPLGGLGAMSGGPSRPDLKQSILSLYASKPAPPPQQAAGHNRQTSFGGMQGPDTSSPSSSKAFGGLDDAFKSLNFSSPTSPPAPRPQAQPKPSAFSQFSQPSTQRSAPAPPQIISTPISSISSGGGFFDSGPKPPPKPAAKAAPPAVMQDTRKASNGFGGFGDFASPIAPQSSSSGNSGLLDFSASPPKPTPSMAAPAKPAPQLPKAQNSNLNSIFNLSQPTPKPAPKPAPTPASGNFSAFSSDPWASDNAWATPDPTPSSAPPLSFGQQAKFDTSPNPNTPNRTTTNDFGAWSSMTSPVKPAAPSSQQTDFGGGWGGMQNPGGFGGNSGFGGSSSGFGGSSAAKPVVAQDEDFGGWSSAAPETPKVAQAPQQPQGQQQGSSKPNGSGGFGSGEDLFGNVWE